MTTLAALMLDAAHSSLAVSRSFLVTRQDRETRGYSRLGVLSDLGDAWAFRYFTEVARDPEIPRLPGLPEADHVAESAYLFPLFAQRVISPRRPDRARVLSTLGLDETATAFEILAKNGGRRYGDTIELIQLPTACPGGGETLEFLVHGMRHRCAEEQRSVDRLEIGEELTIVPEPSNAVDPEARVVTTRDGAGLGWVPAPLVPLLARAVDVRAEVAHANRSDTNPHLRLLVRIRGRLLDAARFDDPRWDLVG